VLEISNTIAKRSAAESALYLKVNRETLSRMDPSRTLYRARREELLKLMKDTNAR